MKSFMKFLIAILIIVGLVFLAYYMKKIDVQDKEVTTKEKVSGEIVDMNSDKKMVFDLSGESVTYDSGEKFEEMSGNLKEDKIRIIDEKIANIESGEVISSVSTEITSDLLWENDQKNSDDYIGTLVNINVKNNEIEIIPAIDFLKNQKFYYDDAGNLILFESISGTVEGSIKYYFENEELIEIVQNYEEGMNPILENTNEILNKAKVVYNKFFTK